MTPFSRLLSAFRIAAAEFRRSLPRAEGLVEKSQAEEEGLVQV